MAMEFTSAANDPSLDTRVRALVDEGMIASHWKALAHYKTGELVLVYSHDELNAIDFCRREQLIGEPDATEFMRKKLSKPANKARSVPSESDAAFWLVAMFSDDQMACVAVKAKWIGSPGSA